jgi:hypothetical protein
VELCREKGGKSGSGARAAQKVEIRKDGTKAESGEVDLGKLFSKEEKDGLFGPKEAAKKGK